MKGVRGIKKDGAFDPPSFSLRDRGPISAKEKATNWKILIGFLIVILFLVLAASMLGIFSPPLTEAQKVEAFRPTREALETADSATQNYIRTESFKPTATHTPEPPEPLTLIPPVVYYAPQPVDLLDCPSRNCRAARFVRKGKTVVVIGIRMGIYPFQSEKWYKVQPSSSQQTANQYVYSEDVMLTLEPTRTEIPRPTATKQATHTPAPTSVYTPMSPSNYYIIVPNGSVLRLCPYDGCKTGLHLHTGTAVVVVGIQVGDPDFTKDNRWYKIQISDGNTISYQYEHVAQMGPISPTTQPTFTLGPSLTPKPTSTRAP